MNIPSEKNFGIGKFTVFILLPVGLKLRTSGHSCRLRRPTKPADREARSSVSRSQRTYRTFRVAGQRLAKV